MQDRAVLPTSFPLRLNSAVQSLSRDVFGGPRILKLAWVVDFQKAGTSPLIALMMWHYGNVAPAAWVYLALHGSYGLCWLIKDLAVPDRSFQTRVTFGGALISFVFVLLPYWVIAWLMVSGVLGPDYARPGAPLMAGCVALHTVGVALMIGSDAQKHAVLNARPGLITGGFYARIRHPNYLGEMMVYATYALMVGHSVAWAILLPIWLLVFLPNIAAQEASLARYPGWPAYKARTGLLWPRVSGRTGAAR
jgi:protein-S-isoprenylcysteine O-methyltransferase Ste14